MADSRRLPIFVTPLMASVIFRSQKALKDRDFESLKRLGEASLDTGAKLYYNRHERGYFVCGYHYNGDDLDPYRKYAKK